MRMIRQGMRRSRAATFSNAAFFGCCCLLLDSQHAVEAFTLMNPAGVTRSVSVPKSATWPSVVVETTRVNMVSYKELMQELPSKPVVDVIAKQGSTRVVAADVAAAAGVSLSQARKDLTALASISRGDIAVDSNGELIYSFPENLKGVLAQNSLRFKATQAFRKAWPVLFWGLRVSFGVALVASVLAIFSTIFFLQTSSSSDDRDDNRGYGGERRGGGMSLGGSWSYWWGPSPFDFFYYRPYGYYGYYGMPAAERRRRKSPEDMGFLESVFSYIFGDGNPNAGLEEKRLALAANLIRHYGGSVTAEQLAPYTQDAPPPLEFQDKTYVDESFVLPIVTALNGEPRVTEDGDIVYVFPELQTSALTYTDAAKSALLGPSISKEALTLRRAGLSEDASTRDIKRLLEYNAINTRGLSERKDLLDVLEKVLPYPTEQEQAELSASDPSVLQEREWKFSLASDLNKILAGGLGVVNLGGALYLGNLFAQIPAGMALPGWYGLVQGVYPFLLVYAVLFNVIPVVRNFWIQQQNAQIQKRNMIRQDWKQALATSLKSSPTLLKKLAEAKKMSKKLLTVGDQDIVFDTKLTMEDLSRQRALSDLENFDKLLESTQEDKKRDPSWE